MVNNYLFFVYNLTFIWKYVYQFTAAQHKLFQER